MFLLHVVVVFVFAFDKIQKIIFCPTKRKKNILPNIIVITHEIVSDELTIAYNFMQIKREYSLKFL